MAEKRVSVRFAAEGSRDVRLAMEGIGQTGEAAFRGIAQRAQEMSEAVRTSPLATSRQLRTAGLAVSAVGAGIAVALRQQLTAADELGKAASRIGVPVEALSELAYAAELSGAGLSELETSLTQLSRRAVESPEDFAALGIAVRDAGGEMRPVAAILDDVADALAGLPEGAERVAAAQKLLGRSGTDLLPLLEGGAAGLRDMTDEARRLGRTVSGETSAGAEKFLDTLTKLRATVTGLALRVTEALLPGLLALSERVLEFAAVVQTLPPEAIEWFAKLAGLLVVGGPLLLGLAAAVKLSTMLLNPWVLLAGAVALAAVEIARNWPQIQAFFEGIRDRAADAAATVADAFWSLKESVSLAVEQALAWVREQFDGMLAWFAELPARMVQVGRDIIDGLRQGLAEAWEDLKDWAWSALPELPGFARRIFETQSPSKVFADIGRDLMEGLRVGMEGSFAGPQQAMEDLAQGLTQAWDSFTDRLISNFGDIRGALAGLAGDLAKVFGRSASQSLSMLIGGALGGATQISGPAMPRAAVLGAPIRSFAGGGFTGWGPRTGGLDGRGGFMAMLHPQEEVIDCTRGRGGRGPRVEIELVIREDPGFAATVETVAKGAAVTTVRQGLRDFSDNVLPFRVDQINRDPRRRG